MISVYIDTNCINARGDDDAINELDRLYHEDKIQIEKADVLDTELNHGSGYPKGQKKSLDYIESYGPVVIGYSRIGFSIIGDEDDDIRFGRILEILWGKRIRSDYSTQEIGDAMHIATAIRYGGNFFVTKEKNILKKSIEINEEFSIDVCDPVSCLEKIQQELKILEDYD